MRKNASGLSGRKSYIALAAIQNARRELHQLPDLDGARSLRSLVTELYDLIDEKRAQGVSWRIIHETINKQSAISLRTLMVYFASESRERKPKPKPRRAAAARR